MKTMWGTLPFLHWCANRLVSSRAARRVSRCASPMAMKPVSQLHWCG